MPQRICSFELVKAEDGLYHFDFVGSNGQILATSPLYRTRENAICAIEAIRASAHDALFEDRTVADSNRLTERKNQ